MPRAAGCRQRRARPVRQGDPGWCAGRCADRPHRRRPAWHPRWAAAICACVLHGITGGLGFGVQLVQCVERFPDGCSIAGCPSSADSRAAHPLCVGGELAATAAASGGGSIRLGCACELDLAVRSCHGLLRGGEFRDAKRLRHLTTVCSHTGQASPAARCGRSRAALFVKASSSRAASASLSAAIAASSSARAWSCSVAAWSREACSGPTA